MLQGLSALFIFILPIACCLFQSLVGPLSWSTGSSCAPEPPFLASDQSAVVCHRPHLFCTQQATHRKSSQMYKILHLLKLCLPFVGRFAVLGWDLNRFFVTAPSERNYLWVSTLLGLSFFQGNACIFEYSLICVLYVHIYTNIYTLLLPGRQNILIAD